MNENVACPLISIKGSVTVLVFGSDFLTEEWITAFKDYSVSALFTVCLQCDFNVSFFGAGLRQLGGKYLFSVAMYVRMTFCCIFVAQQCL